MITGSTHYFAVKRRLGELEGRPVHCDEVVDVFTINRSALPGLIDCNRESRAWSFLDELRENWPVVRLWAKADHGATAKLGAPDLLNRESASWPIPKNLDIESLLSSDDDGGWALFFFDHPDRPHPIPAVIATEPKDLANLLAETNSRAIVISWYDNSEWLVAISNEAGESTRA